MRHSWCSAMSLRVVGEFFHHIPQESNVGCKASHRRQVPRPFSSHNIAFSACDSCHKPLMLGLIVPAALSPSEAYEEHKGDSLSRPGTDKNQALELYFSGTANP